MIWNHEPAATGAGAVTSATFVADWRRLKVGRRLLSSHTNQPWLLPSYLLARTAGTPAAGAAAALNQPLTVNEDASSAGWSAMLTEASVPLKRNAPPNTPGAYVRAPLAAPAPAPVPAELFAVPSPLHQPTRPGTATVA